jgi:hypothetical protein
MQEEKKKNLIKKIDSLSKTLGLGEDQKTLFAIKKTDDPNIKELHLQSGEMKEEDPWFAVDEDDEKKAYAFVPLEAFTQMINILKQTQKENFDLKLEKTIWQNIPQDFDDVWVVAMDEIRELAKSEDNKPVSIDLDKLIIDIKEKHPNLFVNIKDFYPQIENQQGIK